MLLFPTTHVACQLINLKEATDVTKILLTLLLSMSTASAFALTFQVEHPYQTIDLIHTETAIDSPQSLGSLTVSLLESHNVSYIGNEMGIHSIESTPFGDAAIEIISDVEMRVYGWCFIVDGEIPETLAGKTVITASTQRISWFYAYAHYLEGEWLSYCTPAPRG